MNMTKTTKRSAKKSALLTEVALAGVSGGAEGAKPDKIKIGTKPAPGWEIDKLPYTPGGSPGGNVNKPLPALPATVQRSNAIKRK
jgi:hypothetical protein